MKKWMWLLLLTVAASAQQITITGTVKDANGNVYANGSGRAVLVPSAQWQFGNNPIQSTVPILQLSSTGTFSVSLYQTNTLQPNGFVSGSPQWQFSFCNAGAVICFTMAPLSLTVGQDITASIQSQATLLPQVGGGSTTTGTFTSGVNYTPSIWTITGGISPCTGPNEFSQFQPGTTVDVIEGVGCEPVGATNHQMNGLAGYVNSSANSLSRTQANAVGVYGSGRCLTNNCAVWGMNSIAGDAAGLAADNMESLEADINVNGSPTFVDSVQVNGISTASAVFPVNAAEMDLIYNGPVRWPNGIRINPSTSTVSGVWIDANGGTNSGSQVLRETGSLGGVNTHWLDYTDQNGSHHANGAGTYYIQNTVGSLNPPTLTTATVSSLVNAGFVTAATLTSPTFAATAGHSIVVGIQSGINGSNSITGVTDKLGNAYTRLSSGVAGSRDQEYWISPCIAYNTTPTYTTDTITVTQGSSAALGFYAWDVAGLNCSQPFANSSAVQTATGTSGTPAVAALTTISPNEVVFAFIVMSTAQTCTQGAGFTLNNGGSASSMCSQNGTFSTPYSTTTAPATFTSTTWWEGAISLQTAPQLGTPNNPWALVNASKYQTATNCSQNVASPAPCGSATSGAVVIPTTTTTYTVNTTAVTAHSRILLTWLSFASDLPSSPTCVAPSTTTEPTISAVVANTSFTITLTSTTGQTCPQFLILN